MPCAKSFRYELWAGDDGRSLSDRGETDGLDTTVRVVTVEKDFMQLLDEFGSFVEVQGHLDLRGLSNPGFDITRTLNARFAFRSLKV